MDACTLWWQNVSHGQSVLQAKGEYKCLNGEMSTAHHKGQLHGGSRQKFKGPIKSLGLIFGGPWIFEKKKKCFKSHGRYLSLTNITKPRAMAIKLIKTYYMARLHLVKVQKCGWFITVLVSSTDYNFSFWILSALVQFLLWSQWYLLLTCSEVTDSTRLPGPVL